MNIDIFIKDWIEAGNAFETEKYLQFYHEDAVLDDPSVGRKFAGHKEIKDYFESYFIGYNTYTKLVHFHKTDEENLRIEVEFTGDFSEGKLGGIFDLRFKDEKISFAKADLIY